VEHKFLSIYLNDHLAGSVVGSRLARRIAKKNRGNDYGAQVSKIAAEIEEDQQQLEEVMERAGVRTKRPRLALAWLAEKAMRLKPNGAVVGYSPLSRVLDLEGLPMGITGKLELWRSLDASRTGSDLQGIDLARLIERAEDQRDRVEDLRIRAAREALSESTATTDPA
jgi:hypothetical protein